MSRVIAECSGTELVEDGPRILVVQRSVSGYAIVAFVAGLVTLIAGVNGVLQITLRNVRAGIAILGLALVGTVALVAAVRAIRRHRARPLEALQPQLILDRAKGVLCDGAGRPLAPLKEIWFEPRMQLTSSSRSLVCYWPSGSVVIARGSPFLGSIDDLRSALAGLGFRA